MRCTRYGFCGKVAFKNTRRTLFFEVGRDKQQIMVTFMFSFKLLWGVVGCGSMPLSWHVPLPPNVRRGSFNVRFHLLYNLNYMLPPPKQ